MAYVPKGLATVAFLKTRLDEGYDHLSLFEPLILDALAHVTSPDFLAEDIKAVLHERTGGVLLPSNTIQTLLGRCTKQGLLRREGGRFFRTSRRLPESGLQVARTRIQTEQDSLGQAFVQFAAGQGLTIESTQDALAALAAFVSDNKIHLVLNELLPDSPLDRSSLDRKLTRVVARFITQSLESPALRPALEALTEGILLHDTLLMRDIPEVKERFQELLVAFDSGLLFAALDLAGVANAIAAKEGLSLLRQAGARTVAFSRTVDEMLRLLAIYEDRLGTTEGRLSLYPTALTQHLLTTRRSPADIRLISSTIQNRLAQLGIGIIEIPARESLYTLNEENLVEALTDVARPDPEAPRIQHDVNCIAGVLTFRKGRHSTSIERSVAIFSSTSGRVVRNVQRWFFAEGEHGTPPIVHNAALTSIAWLKKPAATPGLKMHEVAALCVAAMRPTRRTMTKFIETLRRLRAEGTITDDETAAVVASELMEPLLARLDDEFEPDSDSIQEAIERVRDAYRREADATAQEAVTKAQADAAATRHAAEEAVRSARAEAALAERTAAGALAARSDLLARIEASISRWSQWVAAGVFWLTVALLVCAAIFSLPGVFDAVGGATKWIARGILAVAAVLGVYSAVHGTSLKDLRGALQGKIAGWIQARWLPAETGTSDSAGPASDAGSG